MEVKPTRPIMRYHGGKWRIGPWVISHLPKHQVYVEPYCGAASILMQKPRSQAEVINDLSGEIVNVFRVLQNAKLAVRLEALLKVTPYSREEFALSYIPTEEPLEMARRTIIRAMMGFGSDGATRNGKTGFRASGFTQRVPAAADWAKYPSAIAKFTDRLSGVVIENRPAIDVIIANDRPEVLFYVDPPYTRSTRYSPNNRKNYHHEMTDVDHRDLAAVLLSAAGMVVISGYRSELYDDLYGHWQRFDRRSYASGDNGGAVERKESLWLNPLAQISLQGRLF